MCNLTTWLRWLSIKTVLWRQLGNAAYDLIRSKNRNHAKSRLLISLTKLDLIGMYEILEDFIRYPPY